MEDLVPKISRHQLFHPKGLNLGKYLGGQLSGGESARKKCEVSSWCEYGLVELVD